VRALALVFAAHAASAACDPSGLIDGPVVVGVWEADMTAGRRACPRSELALGARASALIATDRFYGNLAVDSLLQLSWAWRHRLEVFGTLELVHWQYAQNATIKGSATGTGPLTLGTSVVALNTRRWVLSPYLRLMLPTASQGERVLGGELGAASGFLAHRRVELHGYLALDVTGAAGPAASSPRGGVSFALGVQYTPWRWLGLALDLDFQFAHKGAFDLFALAPAARFRFWRGLGLELAALAPLAGADGHDFALLLRLANRY
jgi:hypothetical protein